MARRIVITSGKGGVGKTTLSVLIGRKLSRMGKKTLILDLDSSLNNLDVMLGVEDKVDFYVEDAVSGRCRAKQALINCGENLFIMQSARLEAGYANGQSIRALIEGLSERFDFIFFDCPAGVDAAFHRAVSCANEALVVINCYPTSVRDADKVINILRGYKLKSIFAVANRTRRDLVLKKKSLSESACEEILKIPVIASVPENDGILCLDKGELPMLAPASLAIGRLAKKIVKEDYTPIREEGGISKRFAGRSGK